MSLLKLRRALESCRAMHDATSAIITATIEALDELAVENNTKPKEAAEPKVRKVFGSSRRETANGPAA